MNEAYLAITVLFAGMLAFSGLGKIRRDPRQVRVIHQTIGVPLDYFPLLAAGEFFGALGFGLSSWHLVVSAGHCGRHRPCTVLRRSNCFAFTCRRRQRHGT
jgi:hypothetical protein